jgi:DNA recombination protein RmuC
LEPLVVIVAVVIALLIGLGVGWLFQSRRLTAVQVERDDIDSKLREADVQIALVSRAAEVADSLRISMDGVRDERDAALRKIVALETNAANFEQRLKDLNEAKELLSSQFSKIGQDILDAAQSKFIDGAGKTLNQASKESEVKLDALLTPIKDTLKRYEENLQRVENDRVGSYGELKNAVAQLAQGNESVRKETQRLANVMRSSPKARGRWGEEQLRNILESAGLAENIDFELQTTVQTDGQQFRPDCKINLPGNRCIIVDVKCPLVHFEQAFDEEDEGLRAQLLDDHAKAMKSYAADLGRKSYWNQFETSPDFVVMFIPGEHFLSAAAERAPNLIESAYRQGVIIASTINMLALAKVMAGMWQQEALTTQAREIADVGRELYKRLSVMGGHIVRLGKNLGNATDAYNDFVGSMENQVLTQAKRFEALKVETSGKEIPSLPVITETPRVLRKLAANSPEVELSE